MTIRSTEAGQRPVSSLERADQVLECLTLDAPQTLTQIVENTGIPRSSAHRLLEKLVDLGWICRVGVHYQHGSRLFEHGSGALRSHWFHQAALPHLEELHRRTSLGVHLVYLDGRDVVFWERIAAVCTFRIPTRVGGRLPATRTAGGKMLLAGLDAQQLARQRSEHPHLQAVTPATINSWDHLETDLARIRRNQLATDVGECFTGLECVAAPILQTGAHLAAISLCGTAEDRPRLLRATELLQRVSAELSRASLRSESVRRPA